MKVINLLGSDFDQACHCLALKVSETYRPDIVIGILTGGGYVGREMFKSLVHSEQIQYTEVKIQREGTVSKSKGLKKVVLTHLPTFMLNGLRMLESLVLERKARRHNPKREGRVEFPENIASLLKTDNKRILLVDDAIDSGATIFLLKAYIQSIYNVADIKVAVVTVTTPHPMVEADFYLFHNRTLVRFPWSNDVKKK